MKKVHIAAIQETKYVKSSAPKKTPNYTLVRQDRGGKDTRGGGLAFLIHSSIPFKRLEQPAMLAADEHLESLTVEIQSKDNTNLRIRNVYIPPASSCRAGYTPPVSDLYDGLGDHAIILGDLNAHHSLWYTEDTEDHRGRQIADWLSNNNLGVLNEDVPTRLLSGTETAPDLTLASASILTSCTWSTEVSLSSDHLPILIRMSTEMKKVSTDKKTYINFAKADWQGFQQYTEDKLSACNLNNNVHASERTIRQIINKAAKKFIPSGRLPHIFNAMSSETANLIKERDEVRKTDQDDLRLRELNKNINLSIKKHRQDKWTEHLKNCEPNSKKLWSTIKELTNPQKRADNQSVCFGKKHFLDPKKIASKLNEQYTPAATTKPSKQFRHFLRKTRQKSEDPAVTITAQQVQAAIKKSKSSKALGPDHISPIMLKHLGPVAQNYLANLYTHAVNQAIIPPLWKVGRIIPLLKPGKPADQGTSYRPISLLSPLAKTLEAIILVPLNQSFTPAPHQHGFMKGRGTVTALQEITQHITEGLNRKKPSHRTVLVAVDLSKAFDTVDHEQLFADIEELPLNHNLKKFLLSYLRGRQTYVEFRGKKSRHRKMRQGVPQGGVLSPILFNIYMAKMPAPPSNTRLVTYADDSTILRSGKEIEPVCSAINTYLDTLNSWFEKRNLFISAPKSSATLFTTWSNEVNKELPIKINGVAVPTKQDPKILGVTLDPMLTFKHHVKTMKDKISSRTNILKALAGSTWGKDKEVLATTYSAIGKSVINYCAPIWTPTLSDTSWTDLQAAQNGALRVITGCTKMTDIGHLHSETKFMPVREHSHMLSKQFLLKTAHPEHPNHTDLTARPERLMKETLVTKFAADILPLAPDGIVDNINLKEGIKTIHKSSVADTITNLPDNKVLGRPAPEVDKSEASLPRHTRTTLAQLRSGYSPYLKSYMARIRPTDHEDICPDCLGAGHSTIHLFNCPAKPTEMTTSSLWESPAEAAEFLGLETGDDPGLLDDND